MDLWNLYLGSFSYCLSEEDLVVGHTGGAISGLWVFARLCPGTLSVTSRIMN